MAKKLLEVPTTPVMPETAAEKARIRETLVRECETDAARSGGKGGQNVNKVSSKAVLIWHLGVSKGFNGEEIARLRDKLKNDITEGGYIRRTCDDGRDFHRNLAMAYDRLAEAVWKALQVPKERIETKVSEGAVNKRIEAKKKVGETKADRRWRHAGDDD